MSALEAVGKWAGQINPNDLMTKTLGFLESGDYSEAGKLLKAGSISEKTYMAGTVIEQISGIANGLIEAKKMNTIGKLRIQNTALEIAKEVFKEQFALQENMAEILKKQTKMLEKINQDQDTVGQLLAQAVKDYQAALMTITTIESEVRYTMTYNAIVEAHKGLKETLDNIVQAKKDIIIAYKIDSSFFTECARQAGIIMQTFGQMIQDSSKSDEDGLKMITSEIGQTIRCFIKARSGGKDDDETKSDGAEKKTVEDKSGQSGSSSSSSEGASNSGTTT